ncbi:glycoside hydrolase family 3 protein [Ornithinimicrobium sp. Y1847]|uniref:glycoside hydrolase family 3 protein n=1 Tax=Ornithinimicrobium sp. Y1847 TaxID=3405419 RepID=UPI003B67F9F6
MTSESTSTVRGDVLAVLSPGFVCTELPEWLAELLREGLGGVWLFGQNVVDDDQLRRLTAQIHEANPTALVCSDEEGGTVTRVDHVRGSRWPGPWALGKVDDTDLTRDVATATAARLVSLGVDLTAAPVADVNVEPENPVIGTRSFGADPELVSRHVVATVEGLRVGGVVGCPKHFPGHGSTTQDSHLTLPTLDASTEVMAQRELVPFRAAVEAGVECVMTGHLVVPAHGSAPATLNASVISLLRDDLGFDGLICTDAIDMEAVAQDPGREEAAVQALRAGVDLVCVGNPVFPQEYDAEADVLALARAVEAAIEDGSLAANRVAEAADRVRHLGARQAERRRAAEPVEQSADAVPELGLRAAAAAIDVTGTIPALTLPVIVGASSSGNMASGARQEVVLSVLARHLEGTVVDLSDAAEIDSQVIVVVDDHTPFDDDTVSALLHHADVVVHTGIRDLAPGSVDGALVRTFSGGLASALAAASVLGSGDKA